jgi:uncharacterized protein (DUF849 family)
VIQAAINGRRSKADHPGIPETTDSIVRDAVESVAAGAEAIHFHVRDHSGTESLQPEYVAEQVAAIKQALPGIPVGISTGQWIEPNPERRAMLISQWDVLPDFVSLNFSEQGLDVIPGILMKKNIGIEAGVASRDDAKRLLDLGLAKNCFRLLIEPDEQDLNKAVKTTESIERLLLPVFDPSQILLHGLESTAWRLFHLALIRNYSSRIGFEDTLYLGSGQMAVSNAKLIENAVRIMERKKTEKR